LVNLFATNTRNQIQNYSKYEKSNWCIFYAVIFLFSFSCNKNEIAKVDKKCGDVSAKFITTWCGYPIAVIEILSDKSLGEDWSWYGKTHHNAVLAVLDSALSKDKKDWSSVIGSSDSVFHFNYDALKEFGTCKICCPPTNTILITSLASSPCPTNN
jgi:hypothetical protein